jgi:hypothetical protein
MATLNWLSEACDLHPDPISGAAITRLTSAPLINNNIYCEQPYTSPNGKRIAFVRITGTPGWDGKSQVFIADLERIRIAPIPGAHNGSNSAWGEWFHYYDEARNLLAFSLETGDHKVVLSRLPEAFGLNSISPDQHYAIGRMTLPGPTIGIGRLDLRTGAHQVIFEHPEIANPHLQFNPIHGRDIMVQHNRGCLIERDGSMSKAAGPEGTTLFAIDRDGGNRRQIPVGQPWTEGATGHECWVADTGRVAYTAHWNWQTGALVGRWREGNLFSATPGDAEPTPFIAPEHRFNHLCISRCGRYFLADSYGRGIPGPAALVVGCFASGKYATLIDDCWASCGGAQFTHPHAYFTADNQRIVWNGDPRGIPHIFAAKLPEGFLASLG